MKLTDLDNFNVSTAVVNAETVKVSLTELDEGLKANAVGKAEQTIRQHFDAFGEGDTVEKAQERALTRALTRKEALSGKGNFRVDIVNNQQISVYNKKEDIHENQFVVIVGVGSFGEVKAEFLGKGSTPVNQRVEGIGQSVNLEEAEDKAYKSALKQLGVK